MYTFLFGAEHSFQTFTTTAIAPLPQLLAEPLGVGPEDLNFEEASCMNFDHCDG